MAKHFDANFKLVLIVSRPVVAANLTEAVVAAGKVKLENLITFKSGSTHSDSEVVKLIGVSSGEWL